MPRRGSGFDVTVFFNFMAKHPAMACICGGILFLLIGGGLLALESNAWGYFAGFGIILLVFGVALHLIWLNK
jgi:hypothetical protein